MGARGQCLELQALLIALQRRGQLGKIGLGVAQALRIQLGLAARGEPRPAQLGLEVDRLPGQRYPQVWSQGQRRQLPGESELGGGLAG